MMGHQKQKLSGMERDVASKNWRKILCVLGRPGVCSYWKNRMNRRERRGARREIQLEWFGAELEVSEFS